MKRLFHTLKFSLGFTVLAAIATAFTLSMMEGGNLRLEVIAFVSLASAIAGTVIAMSRTEDTVIV